jgi:3-methylcrotonyl-CoA carboxylase alpha subunit
MAMFRSLLIANRGEIACRVIRTARRLGIRTIAVYSDADRDALHVRSADTAMRIGPAPARESYLRADAIVAAAREAGAEAIHPGYGFLSENADFAEACARAGLVFVGPSPASIRAMGGKSAAKSLMQQAGVPVVPGYHGDDQSTAIFAEHARRIGYPVLVKASAGGGGKGMRVVAQESDLAEAIDGARREAASSFGDDRVLLEKYLVKPRHIEVQIFGDRHGNLVHLCERDCSLQRRHQKVVEEAPAPGMTPARRAEIGAAAVRAARAVDYVGAGTVEFIVDADGAFHFMEMNTRLQVEHPVTEMITGLDLVEWQLRVAAGEALPFAQDSVAPRGHAIEVRLYAEDPQRDFLPATGRLVRLRFPDPSAHVRVDAGVAAGDAITVHYDPMIAKLVVWDHDRAAALRRLAVALGETQVAGLVTNLDFLRRIAADPLFAAAEFDTGFIARRRADLLPAAHAAPPAVLALATVAWRESRRASGPACWSPWAASDGWRPNLAGGESLTLAEGDRRHAVVWRAGGEPQAAALEIAAQVHAVSILRHDARAWRLAFDDAQIAGGVTVSGDEITVDTGALVYRLRLVDPLAAAGLADEETGKLAAPMPGRVVAVKVAVGARVVRGQVLVVLEAMKMEHGVTAPSDGIVESLPFAVGDQVDEGVDLVGFAAAAPG